MAVNKSFLVVDDSSTMRQLIIMTLKKLGCSSIIDAPNGAVALQKLQSTPVDVVMTDIDMPEMNGLEFIERARPLYANLPIIILSALSQEANVVRGLQLGAQDYLTKPFGLSELEARIRNALRHAIRTQASPEFISGNLRVDLSAREVTVDGKPCLLTPTEYDLLRCFVSQAGKVLTHRHLMRQVWGYREADDLHILRVNISNPRRKLEANPTRPVHLTTEPGVGYRLRVEHAPQQ